MNKPFEAIDALTLYRILQLRSAVFVVEQSCVYQDIDDLDQEGWHLWARRRSSQILAYARLLGPGARFAEPSIGRVLTASEARGRGLGRSLMHRALELAGSLFPGQAVRISAQQYLESFYADLGFQRVGRSYLEDGIPHVEMVRPGLPSEQ